MIASAALGGTGGATPVRDARGSSFFWPMRLLGPSRRRAAFAVYAFCRAVDDIADGDDPAAGVSADGRRAALAAWRRRIDALYRGEQGNDPVVAELAAAVGRFRLPHDAFTAILDGMMMDVDGPPVAPDGATLRLYCARVAGAVGRLLVRIFVPADRLSAGHDAFAEALGEALQLTNILRDVAEDAGLGRLYLPREALAAAGIVHDVPAAVLADPRLDIACRAVAVLAAARFDAAAQLLGTVSCRGLWPAVAMMFLYRRLFDRLVARGWRFEALAGQPRLRLGRWECVGLTLGAAVRAAAWSPRWSPWSGAKS